MLGSNTTATDDKSITIIFSILGGLYGAAAISAVIFIILPRVVANQVAVQVARPVAARMRLPRMVRAARPRPAGTRWAPSYDVVRSRPGAYMPREEIELQRVTRVSAAPNRRFTVPDTVSLLHFYPRDAMLARVFAIATCPSVRPSVRLSVCPPRAGIVLGRAKAGS